MLSPRQEQWQENETLGCLTRTLAGRQQISGSISYITLCHHISTSVLLPLSPRHAVLGACVISCVSLSAKEFILDTVVPVFRKGLFSKKYNVDSYWKSFQTMDHFPGWPDHPSFLLLFNVPKRERWREGSWLEGVVGNEDKKEGYGTVIWRRHMVRVRKAVETGPGQ